MWDVVVNPTAGRGRARRVLRRLHAWLEAHGQPARVTRTQHVGHARDIVARTASDATVVAVGGDGTVHEVASCCIGTSRTLGIVPAGSGDDLAHALAIPRMDPSGALEIIAARRVRTIDTGRVRGEPFVNALGTGFDAEVGALVRRAPRPLSGLSAYLWAVANGLRRLEPVSAQVRVDGRDAYRGAALLVSCLNGPRTGGSFRFAPAADPADGVLDVVVAGSVGRAGVLGLLPRVMVGRHLGDSRIHVFRGRRIEVEWASPRAWHLDGEVLPPAARFAAEVRPQTLRVFAPAATGDAE